MRFGEYTLTNDKTGAVLMRLFHSTVPPGKRTYFEHYHTSFEISTICSGEGIYWVNGKMYHFKKDDVFLLGSDEPHFLVEIFDGEDFNLLNMQIEPRFLWSDSRFEGSHLLKIFYGRNERFENRLDRTNPTTAWIKDMILKAEKEFRDKDFEYAFMIKMAVFEILIKAAREYNYVNLNEPQMRHTGILSQLEQAMEYIDRNIGNPLTLDDLAREAYMNRSYFSTIFKKFNGISPWEYITIKRVEKSIDLLQTTELSKIEIAAECGFSSASNFYKTFRKITGKQPSAYTQRTTGNE